ncbi:MAG: ABC transporter permease [Bacteroidetes bacterium]|nr:ABC transporter permease [Bacteroidota bacterium]
MIKNYFTIAWRNLLKNKTSSFINIAGLAAGMAVAMLIGFWIYDEVSYDQYHTNYKHIARVMQHQTSNGYVFTSVAIPFPLGEELQSKDGSDFKYIVRSSWNGSHILSLGDQKISVSGSYMDAAAPKMLTLKMQEGNNDGLKEMNTILLSAASAKALFGDKAALNQVIKIDNKLDVKVTGVYEDLPHNTTFRELNFIAPWDLYVSSEPWIKNSMTQWGNNSFQLFAQIADHADFDAVNKKIINVKQDRVSPEEKKFNAKIFLHPMQNWHLHSKWENGVNAGGAIEYVRMFLIVGIFVLLLACINFMNLSTARSEKRAKEVGIRKSIGSLRSQLIGQFFSESLLVVAFAFILSLLITQFTLPLFNDIAGKQMKVLWANPVFWMMGIGFALFTGIIAGCYPALYLSSFKPVKVLKGTFKAGRLAALPRRILVVLQFTVSVTLIIGTMVVYRQIQYSKDRPVGYDRNALMMVEAKSPDFIGKAALMRNELLEEGAVTQISESSSPVTDVWSNNGGMRWPGKDPNQDADFATIWISHDFGKTVGWHFKEGRDLSRDFPGDSSSMVINESAVKFMGLKEPVGTVISWGDEPHVRKYTVVGVIDDMLMQSPYEPVKQTIYLLGQNDDVNWINLKLNPAKSLSSSIAAVEAAFKKYVPNAPFEYKFANEEFAKKFITEERVGKLAGTFAILAVLISCLGLFGLSAFVAEQRTKEIGVRKVLGASVLNVWQMLCKDFVQLVIIACVIAAPLAWYYLHSWLDKYSYRTTISVWVFAGAFVGALLITLITVSFQSIKAALMNPVKSLRTE